MKLRTAYASALVGAVLLAGDGVLLLAWMAANS